MQQTSAKTPAQRSRGGRKTFIQDAGFVRLLLITVGIFAVMSLLRPEQFFTVRNVRSMAFQFPEFAILSLAVMLAMLTGGIDLSVVGAANLSAILAAIFMRPLTSAGVNPILVVSLGILVALIVGVLAGFINGVLIAKIGVPPILATLGTSQVFTGIGFGITDGRAVLGLPAVYSVIGNGSLGVFPVPAVIFTVLAVVVAIVLNRTPLGEKIYMLGTNPLAARFAGLGNDWILIRTYTICGVMASVAGLVMMSRANSAKADFGASYLLLSVLIAVLGGTNPYGGFGKVAGVVLAVLSLQFLSSGFNILRISNFAKEFVWGGLLLLVMVMSIVIIVRRRTPEGLKWRLGVRQDRV
jgi:simple sugar transport system permease protein